MMMTTTMKRGASRLVSLSNAPRCRLASLPPRVISVLERMPLACRQSNTPPESVTDVEVPCCVFPDVVTAAEAECIAVRAQEAFRRVEAAEGHYDNLITQYKEFYRFGDEQELRCGASEVGGGIHADYRLGGWPGEARAALLRCRNIAAAFTSVPIQPRVHFLQLAADGFIRPHADDTTNSSAVVCGLTLLSARVMSLNNPRYSDQRVDMLLAPRSFYCLWGSARTEWLHSVDCEVDGPAIPRGPSQAAFTDPIAFDGAITEHRRGQRIAVIFRGLSPMEFLRFRQQSQLSSQG